MTELTSIPPNVWEFMGRAAQDIGRIKADAFSHRMHAEIVEKNIASPIEQLFYVALNVMCQAVYVLVNPGPDVEGGQIVTQSGLYVEPQASVDRYRVDFMLTWVSRARDSKTLIVELDGHDFHDKDKNQRSYEKARDRHLLRAGFQVLHFTGSDVVKDPYRVVHEVLETLGGFSLVNGEYDPTNIFGID